MRSFPLGVGIYADTRRREDPTVDYGKDKGGGMDADRELLIRFTAQLQQAGCVFAAEEAGLILRGGATVNDAESMLRRRLTGEPLEYVLGWAAFMGRRVRVMPGVFIPRPRTEFLAVAALESARGRTAPVILDLCCGAGALSSVFAADLPDAELYAADLAPEAVAAARMNLGTRVPVYQSDLFTALPRHLHGRIDIIVANAPYVPTEQLSFLPREARLHEPAAALDGGRQGLEVLRRIAAQAPVWLGKDGQLLVECSAGQAPDLAADVSAAGFQPLVRTDPDTATAVVSGTLAQRIV
ncbi:putative protein N(5)-glutamine methyltransferase [Arthrobacter koreensis]|uniref:putative protein N(5)-glutamine methyltransferase n=1 Tax=Arthrobacter koreensis TaxID=199136 RepID=UPI002DBDA240|nr:putative protein N(5)-glutamine methyltransferase [Arthrobacter koreensis]MEB7447331.1 putative protein N(5)-glutamine methyltransferase [Arthrobacter koreensis]